MQRDFDLVVTILGAIRDADSAALSQQEIETAVQASMPDAPPAPLVAHHMDILQDAGLVAPAASPEGGSTTSRWRLTWKGYDALEQEEEDEDDED